VTVHFIINLYNGDSALYYQFECKRGERPGGVALGGKRALRLSPSRLFYINLTISITVTVHFIGITVTVHFIINLNVKEARGLEVLR
jgi:hypothetical protein